MNALILQSDSNLQAATILVPDTNARPATPVIMPERFGSTTRPSKFSIVPLELGSVSEPKPVQPAPQTK